MDRRIAKLSRNPFFVSLVDRAIRMYVDSGTGDVFIDEGDGKGRMNGAGLFADQGTRFSCERQDSICIIKIACETFIWDAGWTGDAEDARSWVEAVNRFLETKRGTVPPNGRVAPQAPAKSAID